MGVPLPFDTMIQSRHMYQLAITPGSIFLNTLWWRVGQTGTPTGGLDSQVIADALDHHWKIEVSTLVSEKLELVRTDIQWGLNNGPVLGSASSTLAGILGGDAAPLLPTQNCLLYRLRSTTPGREGRGRVYVPGLTVDTVEGSNLIPVYEADAQSKLDNCWGETLTTDATTATFPDGFRLIPARIIWTPNVPNIFIYRSDIASTSVDSIIRAQRRRQPDRGT